ncbi:MAG: hypothetical protein Q4C01_07685 [Clostridia bacterium]|nr:hypothetical protein [Clostridia bacterium]
MWVCENCGKSNDAAYCFNCGKARPSFENKTTPSSGPMLSAEWTVKDVLSPIMVIVAVLLLLFAPLIRAKEYPEYYAHEYPDTLSEIRTYYSNIVEELQDEEYLWDFERAYLNEAKAVAPFLTILCIFLYAQLLISFFSLFSRKVRNVAIAINFLTFLVACFCLLTPQLLSCDSGVTNDSSDFSLSFGVFAAIVLSFVGAAIGSSMFRTAVLDHHLYGTRNGSGVSVWRCSCGKVNVAGAQRCSSCGSHRPSPISSESWRCYCGKVNKAHVVFCTSCSRRRGYVPPFKPTSWSCQCGKVNSLDSNFCSECGKSKKEGAFGGSSDKASDSRNAPSNRNDGGFNTSEF